MIWATGDCHGNFERFKPEYFPEQAEMTKEDTMIICGDFGGVWFGDSRDDDDLDWLNTCPSHWHLWMAITKTMTPLQPSQWRNGTAERSTVSVPICCT